MIFDASRLARHAGALLLSLTFILFGSVLAIERHSVIQANSVSTAESVQPSAVIYPAKLIHPGPHTTDICLGVGIVILLVAQKYRIKGKWQVGQPIARLKVFDVLATDLKWLPISFSLPELGVSRT